jgi:hypothetical protein
MKQQTQRKPMDEREKLRKFRELDDAFAEALRELDNPNAGTTLPGEPEERGQATSEEGEATRQEDFEMRLNALMQEYQKPAEQVADLLVQLKALGRIA